MSVLLSVPILIPTLMAALQAVKQFRIRELAPVLKANPSIARPKVLNPFLPHKNPESGRWAPPKYSLRRQAELVKQARTSGTLHLLPPGPKLSPKVLAEVPPAASLSTDASVSPAAATEGPWWGKDIEWEGELKEKEVKGADVGNRLYAGKKRMFKGHKWERTLEKRTWERKVLLKDMQARIDRFRTVSGRLEKEVLSRLSASFMMLVLHACMFDGGADGIVEMSCETRMAEHDVTSMSVTETVCANYSRTVV